MTENIIDLLMDEHHETLAAIDNLMRLTGEGEREERIEKFLWLEREFEAHMYGEERVLYPLMEGTMHDSIEGALDDHERIRRGLLDLFGAWDRDSEWEEGLTALKDAVSFHFSNEEKVLQKIRETSTDGELADMRQRYEDARQNYLGAIAELIRSAEVAP